MKQQAFTLCTGIHVGTPISQFLAKRQHHSTGCSCRRQPYTLTLNGPHRGHVWGFAWNLQCQGSTWWSRAFLGRKETAFCKILGPSGKDYKKFEISPFILTRVPREPLLGPCFCCKHAADTRLQATQPTAAAANPHALPTQLAQSSWSSRGACLGPCVWLP